MRIGIDASILAPRTRDSGIGRYVTRLIEHMPRLAPESRFVLFAPAACPRPVDLAPNVAWQALPRPPLGKLSTPASYLLALPRLAREWRLDVFHAPTVHPRPSWPPVPRRLGCPLVVTVHDVIPLTFYARGPSRLPRTHLAFYRWNLRAAVRASAMITVSQAERETIARVLGVPRDGISVVYNGADAPVAASPNLRIQAPYILFVGSYERRKNLAMVIRSYGIACQRGLTQQLVVVATSGSGPDADVRPAVGESALLGRVRFVEGRRIGDGELADLYTGADMFVYPSLADSFGLPPLEAMAAGTPVIASDLPALREVLGDAAVFADGRDEQAIARAMLRLAGDAGERARRATAGLAWASRYSWESCARQTLDVYRQVVASSAGPGSVERELAIT